jgi:hypothetical protein
MTQKMHEVMDTKSTIEDAATPSVRAQSGITSSPIDDETLAKAKEFLRRPKTEDEIAEERPAVTVPGGAMTITESATALFKAIAPKRQLFYRGGVVVEMVKEESGYEVKVVDAVAAQSRFEKYVRFQQKKLIKERWWPSFTNISEATAKQYLKSEACRTYLPKLNGILHAPLVVEKEGRLHRIENGYDEATGFFVAGGQIPENVTLTEAVQYLKSLIRDFDFVTPGDKSRAIASLLTPAMKFGGFINGSVPVDVAEANASQSGKTYRQKIVAALYNQTLAVVTKKGGGVGSMEETFSDHLVKAKVFVQFDNVRGKLDSQMLESFLTSGASFPARIPYHGSVSIDPSKFVLFISSNGFEATKDLTNRASIIRIRKRENYQYATCEGMDILQLAFAMNHLFMGAVFRIIEEWFNQGKKITNETQHDFREWCQTLDWIVQNIFEEAPLMDGHGKAKERAASPQLTFIRAVAIKLNERGKLDEEISASEIADAALDADIEIPGLSAENQSVEEGRKVVGKIMAKHFENTNELGLDEFKVLREERSEKSEMGNSQKIFRYVFSLGNSNPDEHP